MLVAGSTLGPYKILALLGAGGMGEVYRAHDTRLGRDVAIKVLAPHLSAAPEVRARFEREARTISQLNHPHICTLHDVGRDADTDFLVMELVEGETLGARLAKGALPTSDVLRLGAQIADALDRAHRAGVVHRDLKPGNVMLTKSGAKLMDFGLARTSAPILDASGSTESPTMSRPLTAAGMIVGTLQYMAPEQLEGREADPRADIWALGCVLYEMATGAKAFDGKSQASLIAAILKEEPRAMTDLQPLTPPGLERIVKRCLAKDPDERFQSASDLAFGLQALAPEMPRSQTSATAVGATPTSMRSAAWRRPAMWAGAAALLLLVILVGAHWLATPSAPKRATILDLTLPAGVDLGDYPSAALSKDGGQVVFVAAEKYGTALWLRSLASANSVKLPGTTGADLGQQPIWSPDGRYLLFAAENKIKKIDLASATVTTLWTDASGLAPDDRVFYGDWNDKGDILYSWMDLYRLRANGGEPERIATRGQSETAYIAGSWLPDGRHYLYFVRNRATGKAGVYAGALGSPNRKLILASEVPACYVKRGFLIFPQGDVLYAQRFDPAQRKLLGNAVRLVEGVAPSPWLDQNYWVSGTTLAFARAGRHQSQLTWFDRSGHEVGRVGDPLDVMTFDLSKDDTRIAASIGEYTLGARLALVDATRPAAPVWLTAGPSDLDARFGRDGAEIIFSSEEERGQGVFRLSISDRTRRPLHIQTREALYRSDNRIVAHDWSRDGRFMIYGQGAENLQVGSAEDGAQKPVTIAATGYPDQARFSPDGHWIAYNAFESGTFAGTEQCQIYVSAYPPNGDPQRITTRGGVQPMWRADGRELYYLDPEGNLMAMAVAQTAQAFTAGPPRLLFDTGLRRVRSGVEEYAVARDGQRFLVKLPAGGDTQAGFSIVLNWPALLSSAK